MNLVTGPHWKHFTRPVPYAESDSADLKTTYSLLNPSTLRTKQPISLGDELGKGGESGEKGREKAEDRLGELLLSHVGARTGKVEVSTG